jgi:hypothetical protein
MNDTNRALNRAVLLLAGLVLTVLGGAAAAAAAVPAIASTWSTAGSYVVDAFGAAADSTRIDGASLSWVAIAAVAVLVATAAVLIWALTTLVSRRSKTVLRSGGQQTPLGRVIVTEAFAADAVKSSLARQPDVIAASVTAHSVRDQPVLHVSVTTRHNADPRDVVDHVMRILDGLTAVAGTETAGYISVHGGVRSRLASDARRVD